MAKVKKNESTETVETNNAPELGIVTLEEAIKAHPTAKEVHVNERGEWHFGPKSGIHASFGKYTTTKI